MRIAEFLDIIKLDMEASSGFTLEQVKLSIDRSTYANYNDVKTTHLHFDWYVNFDTSAIEGSVVLKMHTENDIQLISLDSWQLDVTKVSYTIGSSTKEATFKI
jgi:hypothetical protein